MSGEKPHDTEDKKLSKEAEALQQVLSSDDYKEFREHPQFKEWSAAQSQPDSEGEKVSAGEKQDIKEVNAEAFSRFHQGHELAPSVEEIKHTVQTGQWFNAIEYLDNTRQRQVTLKPDEKGNTIWHDFAEGIKASADQKLDRKNPYDYKGKIFQTLLINHPDLMFAQNQEGKRFYENADPAVQAWMKENKSMLFLTALRQGNIEVAEEIRETFEITPDEIRNMRDPVTGENPIHAALHQPYSTKAQQSQWNWDARIDYAVGLAQSEPTLLSAQDREGRTCMHALYYAGHTGAPNTRATQQFITKLRESGINAATIKGAINSVNPQGHTLVAMVEREEKQNPENAESKALLESLTEKGTMNSPQAHHPDQAQLLLDGDVLDADLISAFATMAIEGEENGELAKLLCRVYQEDDSKDNKKTCKIISALCTEIKAKQPDQKESAHTIARLFNTGNNLARTIEMLADDNPEFKKEINSYGLVYSGKGYEVDSVFETQILDTKIEAKAAALIPPEEKFSELFSAPSPPDFHQLYAEDVKGRAKLIAAIKDECARIRAEEKDGERAAQKITELLDKKNPDGDTLMTLAALNGEDGVVDLLCTQGASAHIENDKKHTAHGIAVRNCAEISAGDTEAQQKAQRMVRSMESRQVNEWINKLSDEKYSSKRKPIINAMSQAMVEVPLVTLLAELSEHANTRTSIDPRTQIHIASALGTLMQTLKSSEISDALRRTCFGMKSSTGKTPAENAEQSAFNAAERLTPTPKLRRTRTIDTTQLDGTRISRPALAPALLKRSFTDPTPSSRVETKIDRSKPPAYGLPRKIPERKQSTETIPESIPKPARPLLSRPPSSHTETLGRTSMFGVERRLPNADTLADIKARLSKTGAQESKSFPSSTLRPDGTPPTPPPSPRSPHAL